MKKLLLGLLLVSTAAFGQMAYTIKVKKEVVEIHQADGIVVTLPRSKPEVGVVDGEVVITSLVKMTKGGEKEEYILVVANTQTQCQAGKGKVGLLNVEGDLIGLMDYNEKENTVAKFVGNYLCEQAGIRKGLM